MVPYDVQLMGGIQLHLGKIAEMATGEGKTLVATLPLYLNALPGKGAHLVTVNSYLARRDSQWMGHLYRWLGLTVGCLDDTEAGTPERRAAYLADITYGTNNEFGFDYLRDNMVRVARAAGAAQPRVRDRGRGGLRADRRGADAADHLRPGRERGRRPVLRAQRRRLAPRAQADGAGERARRRGRARCSRAGGSRSAAALKLYQAQLGHPKNRRLLKLMNEPGNKQLVQKMELEHLADRKLPPAKQSFRDIEEDLLFVLDEKGHSVHLTDRGVDFMSPSDHDAFVLPDISARRCTASTTTTRCAPRRRSRRAAQLEIEYASKSERLNIVHQLLRAHALYEKDVNYVVQDGEVLIVDEFTGRTMPGRRWSEGLHQAVEAKEGVRVKGETQTLATITIQNYFRMYEKLAGMTGTAETEETEFFTDLQAGRRGHPDEPGRHPRRPPRPRLQDAAREVQRHRRRDAAAARAGLSGAVGTTSVEASETLSKLMQRAGLAHNVLNAKYHQREAEIVADAGQPGAITIATNMAGRGTDIKLGEGVTRVEAVGGEGSRRQGRRGRRRSAACTSSAPSATSRGASTGSCAAAPAARAIRARRQFFLSLEDDLMRLFGSERIARLMDRMGAQEGEVLTHPLITRSIEQAQKRVELQNFQSRKRLLEYDDVMNQQREVIYSLRAFALEGGEELKGEALKMVEKAVSRRVETLLAEFDTAEEWDFELLNKELLMHYLLQVPEFEEDANRPTELDRRAGAAWSRRDVRRSPGKVEALDLVRDQEGGYGDRLLRYVMLNVLDEKWKDHLYDLDQLRNSIHYRSYGQKDPLIEYKQEAYSMFVDLMNDVAETFTDRFLKVQLVIEEGPPAGDGRPEATRRSRRLPPRRRGATTRSACWRRCRRRSAATGTDEVVDVGPAESPSEKPAAAKRDPVIVGAGKARSMSDIQNSAANGPVDWTNVGPQRSVSVRVGQEVQEVPRRDDVDTSAHEYRIGNEPDAGLHRARFACGGGMAYGPPLMWM